MDEPLHNLPVKAVLEQYDIALNLSERLAPGEVIVDGSAEVVVSSGEDPSPNDLLAPLGLFFTDTIIGHKIRRGISGVIYKIIFTAETSEGNVLVATVLQAVVPNGMPPGEVYTYRYFTSRPYPIDVLEEFTSTGSAISAAIWQFAIEGIDSDRAIVSGELRDLLRSYNNWPPEGIDSTSAIQSGDLDEILITYDDWPPEGVDSTSAILSGDLYSRLITYTNWPAEGVDSSSSIISGTLV